MLDAFASGGPHKVCRTVRGSARAHYAASVSSLVLGIMFCLPQSAGGGASTAAVPRYARARRTHSRHASLGALRAVVAFAYARYHVFYRGTRTARVHIMGEQPWRTSSRKTKSGRCGGFFPSYYLTREGQSDIFLSNFRFHTCKFLKACYIYSI